MNNPAHRLIVVTTLIVAAIVVAQPGFSDAGGQATWIDVLSVKVDANGLIIIVCRGVGETKFVDGAYRSSDAGVVFDNGTIVSVTGRDEFGVEEVTLGDEDQILLLASDRTADRASPDILPDGQFRLRGGPGRDRTETPQASGFRVRRGAIVSALVAR